MNLQDLTPVAWLIPGTVTKDAALARVNGKNATPLYTRDDLKSNAERMYRQGWINAAKWAQRDDLIADIDSKAYAIEMSAAKEGLTL